MGKKTTKSGSKTSKQEQEKQTNKAEKTENIVAVAVVGMIILLVLFIWTKGFGLLVVQIPILESTPAASTLVDNDPHLGNASAPLTIVQFSDFQCPYCATFALTVFPLIKERYVETGKVQFVFRDFPLTTIHNQAYAAALAAECAYEQDQFWEYHDLLYMNQAVLGGDALLGYANSIEGIDLERFTLCLSTEKYKEEVLKDINDARSAGVASTPFFVGNATITGTLPFLDFAQVIEEQLSS